MKSDMLRKSLQDSRLEFRYTMSMLDLRAYAYARVRHGLDPKGDLDNRIKFFWRVQLIRIELEK